MNNAFVTGIFTLFSALVFAQVQMKPIIPPSDEEQIKSVINSITQGIKQSRIELILSNFDDQFKDFDDTNLNENDRTIRVTNFFSASEKRKTHSNWKRLTPSTNLPANWDFEVENPVIIVTGEIATVNFKLFWLADIGFSNDSTKIDLFRPNRKKDEVWTFQKTDNQWKLVKSQQLLKFMKLVSLEK